MALSSDFIAVDTVVRVACSIETGSFIPQNKAALTLVALLWAKIRAIATTIDLACSIDTLIRFGIVPKTSSARLTQVSAACTDFTALDFAAGIFNTLLGPTLVNPAWRTLVAPEDTTFAADLALVNLADSVFALSCRGIELEFVGACRIDAHIVEKEEAVLAGITDLRPK